MDKPPEPLRKNTLFSSKEKWTKKISCVPSLSIYYNSIIILLTSLFFVDGLRIDVLCIVSLYANTSFIKI